MNNCIVHITSWQNRQGETYSYDGFNVGVLTIAENIDSISSSFLQQQVSGGYFPVSHGISRVSHNNLDYFKSSITEIELDETSTYQLESLLMFKQDLLCGIDVSLRYRNAIHFCENLLASIAECDVKRQELVKHVDIIEQAIAEYDANKNILGEELDLNSSILYEKKLRDSIVTAQSLLENASSEQNILLESKSNLISKRTNELEQSLRMSGYKSPILKFRVNS